MSSIDYSLIIVSIGFILVIASIAIVLILASKSSNSTFIFPDQIDAIIIDKGRGRYLLQSNLINKYMSWIDNVVVLHINDSKVHIDPMVPNNTISSIPVVHVDTNYSKPEEIIHNIKSIYPDVNDHVLFFGDTTIPIKTVHKINLLSLSKKNRLFNYFFPDLESLNYNHFVEETFPFVLMDIKDIAQTNVRDYILSKILTEDIIYSPTINRYILFMMNESVTKYQTDTKFKSNQFFCTLFLDPNAGPEQNKQILDFVSSLC